MLVLCDSRAEADLREVAWRNEYVHGRDPPVSENESLVLFELLISLSLKRADWTGSFESL